MSWKIAKDELPARTQGAYSDADVFIARMFVYDIGRTLNGKWVNMKNEPIDDVILWMYKPPIGKEFNEAFNN